MRFYVEFEEYFKTSSALWFIIKDTKVNLTDTGDKVFVYGQVSEYALGWILAKCAMFGKLKVSIPYNKIPPCE